MTAAGAPLTGHSRGNGRKGIRNHVLVAYPVACAHPVARELLERLRRTANGLPTRSEALGHRKLLLACRTFGPLDPSRLPA
jgi:altronate dehydratase